MAYAKLSMVATPLLALKVPTDVVNPTLLKLEPSPENDVAVNIPVTTAPVLVVSNFLLLA